RLERELIALGAGQSGVELKLLGLRRALGLENHLLVSQNLGPVAHRKLHLLSGVSKIPEGHLSGQPRIGQRARRQSDVADLEVPGDLLLAEPHRMNGNLTLPDLRDGVAVDSA